MTFKEYVHEAAEKLQKLDPAAFFTSPKEEQEELIESYVQHRAIDARNWFPFIRLDGVITNTSRLHFGNEGAGGRNLIKKALYEDGYTPLISDNAVAGMFRIPLQTISHQIWGDDEDITNCGYFTEKGSRFQCLKCLGCGLAGGLKPDTGENAVHKVSAVTGLPLDAEIIEESRNAMDPRTGTTPKWEFINPEKTGKEKLATYWHTEYVAPGAKFPISITMRDVAAVELGLSLMAFDTSWKNIGLGAHKNGRFQGWYENPERFTMQVWAGNWLEEPERYQGAELLEIMNVAKKTAYLAQSKKLLVKYNLDTSMLRGVKTAKERDAGASKQQA